MTDANHKKILDKVDASRDQAIGFLQKMVAIPSVTGDEAAIQRFLSDYMKQIGLEVDLWETDWEALRSIRAIGRSSAATKGGPISWGC